MVNVTGSALGEDLHTKFLFKSRYIIPKDSGRKTALSREIIHVLKESGIDKGCFEINDFGVWPSSENQDIFYGYRLSLGEKRSILEAPYHLFTTSDYVQLESLFAISLYFFWDTLIVDEINTLLIETSNDEVISVYTVDKKLQERFKLLLVGMKLEELE